MSSGVPTIIRPLTFASGIGTFDTAGATGVRLGEAVIAVALNNEVLTAANWPDAGTPIRTQDAVVAPDGNTTADRIEDDSATVVEGITQAVTVANDSEIWVATVWVLCASAHDVTFRLSLSGGTLVTTATTAGCTTTWRKLTVTSTNNASGNVTATLELDATAASDVALLGVAEFWRPQLYRENTDVFIDPAVAGTAITTNREQLTYSAVTVGNRGTLCTWVWMNANDANTRYVANWDNVVDHQYRFTFDSTSRPVMESLKLADNMAVTSVEAVADETWHHVCWQWNAALTTQPVTYIDGVASTILGGADHTFTSGTEVYGSVLDMDAGNAGEHILSRTVFYDQVIATSYMVRLYNMSSALYARAPVPTVKDWLYAHAPAPMQELVAQALGLDVEPRMPKPVFASAL